MFEGELASILVSLVLLLKKAPRNLFRGYLADLPPPSRWPGHDGQTDYYKRRLLNTFERDENGLTCAHI